MTAMVGKPRNQSICHAQTLTFEGTLKSWNDDKGFGFISPSQSGQDIFVHIFEATWFRKNWPGTKMGGDHDGVPCETQLCR